MSFTLSAEFCRMKILLCAATEMEIAPTIQFLSQHPNPSIDVFITGVGLMTCTYALTKTIIQHQSDFIIQAGVAGSLDAERELAQVVVIENEIIGDLGVKENKNFRSLFDLKLVSTNAAPWKNGKLCNENNLLKEAALPIVDGVTVNEISTRAERIRYYRQQLKVQVETMEGAALHYVALMEKIPFLQMRSLSNFIGERDKSKWKMKEAIHQLNLELQHLLAKHFSL